MLLRLIQTMSSLSEISVDTNDDDSSNALTTRTADLTCDLTWDFLCLYQSQHIAPISIDAHCMRRGGMIVPKPDAFTQREKHQFCYGTASNLRLRRISRMRTVVTTC